MSGYCRGYISPQALLFDVEIKLHINLHEIHVGDCSQLREVIFQTKVKLFPSKFLINVEREEFLEQSSKWKSAQIESIKYCKHEIFRTTINIVI